MIYSVYHIALNTNLNEGYVGVTCKPALRFSQHGWQRKSSNQHLRNAFRKYEGQIQCRVIATDLDREGAELVEAMLRPEPNIGWNIAAGGGIPPSPKGRPRSPEHCAAISKAKLGELNPMYGKRILFSEQQKARLSAAAKLLPMVKCPHCGKTGRGNGMKRWHFDGCSKC